MNPTLNKKYQIRERKDYVKWYEQALKFENEPRHVLGISGGKDSAALAIYIKDNYPEISEKMEYFFQVRR